MIKFTEYKDLVKDYEKNEKLFHTAHRLNNKRNATDNDVKRAEALLEEYGKFRNTVLARKTFEILVKLNPFVRERRTNSFFHFKDIYGEDFDALEDKIKAHIAQYLDIGSYPYPLCEQIERPDGDIKDVEEYEPCETGYETPIWKDGKVVDYGYECGVPSNYFWKFEPDIRVQHGRVWDAMSQEEKEEWMKNKSWKTLVDKYIK